MSDRLDFLRALLGGHDGDFAFDKDGEKVSATPDKIATLCEADDLLLYAITPDNRVPFFWAMIEDVEDEDEWMGMRLAPTVVLQKKNNLLVGWALDQSAEATAAVRALGTHLDPDFDTQPIPLPGTRGWGLVRADAEGYFTLEDVTRVYGSSTAAEEPASATSGDDDAAPWDLPSHGTYLDAVLRTPFDINDPVFAQETVVTLGAYRDAKNWKPTKMPFGVLVTKLCQHEIGKKDGLSLVLGEMVAGPRKNNSVVAINGLGIDIDTGMPAEQIDAALLKLKCLAVRYTTHSNGATRTLILRDTIVKKMGTTKIDTKVLRDYLATYEEWVPDILASVEYDGTEHTERGIQVVATHRQMAKNRVVLPFAEPFRIADAADTQKDALAKWKLIPQAVADLLGVPLDKACLEAARLFFLPRHDKDKPFDISLFGGKLFDWRSLDIDNPLEVELKRLENGGKKAGGPTTAAGQELGRWAMRAAHGFQIATLVEDYCPDKVRFAKSPGNLEIECPFDEEHSNAGDAEDRACFVVNAGDGDGEAFFARCRHDSCRTYNNIDMLGKMLADEWFAKDVLEDPNYNLAEPEDAPNPEAAKKIAKEDEAKKDYEEAIAVLTDKSGEDEIFDAISLMLKANLNAIQRSLAERNLKKNLKNNRDDIKRYISHVKSKLGRDSDDGGDSPGFKQKMFEYEGEFHFPEAVTRCLKELQDANQDAKGHWSEPQFTCFEHRLMRLQWNTDKTRINFEQLDAGSTWAELNNRLVFVRLSDGVQGKAQKVSEDVAKQAFESAYRMLPQTPEVLYTPCFTKAGRLITEPRWYKEDGDNIFLVNTGFKMEEVSEEPTQDEVDEAVDWLINDLLVDFAFLDTDLQGNERVEPSRANAIAMLVTPFMRRMITGVTPVFFITKPQPGTGGTLLGSLPLEMFDGEQSMPLAYTQSEDEMRKILVSSVTETRSHLFFDDVKEFNNRVLLQSITSKYIGGRILGSSKNIERPNTFGWNATGNNPIIGSEMERRICWVRLNAKIEDIQARVYKMRTVVEDGREVEVDYKRWMRETRARTVWAILTLIQNWMAEGQRPFTLRSLASFEDWAKKVGGVLQAAGIEGFLDNRRVLHSDTDEAANKEFVREWLHHKDSGEGKPIFHKSLLQMAIDLELDILDGNNDDQKKQRFYKRLHSLVGRVFRVNKVDFIIRETIDAESNPALVIEPLAKHKVEAA
jgi:hypothetical protein